MPRWISASGPTKTSSPSAEVRLERLPGRVADLEPYEVRRLFAQPPEHVERDGVPARAGELVDVERERRACARCGGEMRQLRRGVELEVRRPDHGNGGRPGLGASAASATVSAVVWAPQWAATSSLPAAASRKSRRPRRRSSTESRIPSLSCRTRGRLRGRRRRSGRVRPERRPRRARDPRRGAASRSRRAFPWTRRISCAPPSARN